jgi:imidazolonepropionase-like amidohydrolase
MENSFISARKGLGSIEVERQADKRMNKKILNTLRIGSSICLGVLLSSSLFSQTDTVALRGAKLVTVTQGVIENGTLLIKEGKIASVGAEVTLPPGATVIDCTGKTVTPGMIDGFTNLGTADLPSFGKDDDEATNAMTPHLRIIDALNPDNRFIPLARQSGVTAVLCAPGEGNLLTGQSALIRLSGHNLEDMVIQFPTGVHGVLGEAPKLRYGKKSKAPMTRMGAAALLRQKLVDAEEYDTKLESYREKLEKYESEGNEDSDKPSRPAPNLELEALLPVVRGEKPLVVSADRLDDILTALRIAEEFELELILSHGAEAYRVAERLAAKRIPVILGPAGAYYQRLETLRANPENARLLQQAGVSIAFQTGSVEDVSGLLEQARTAVRHGLNYDEAVKALTLNPARIFGVDDQIGSLQVGKSADLVVFDGDPINELARVEMVFIQGQRYSK